MKILSIITSLLLLSSIHAQNIKVEPSKWKLVGATEDILSMEVFTNNCVNTVWTYDDGWKAYSANDSTLTILSDTLGNSNIETSISMGEGFWIHGNEECDLNTNFDIKDFFSGKTFYTTIYDTVGTMEKWQFNSDMTEVTFTELVGGSDSGTDTVMNIGTNSFDIIETGNEANIDESDKLTVIDIFDDYLTASIDDSILRIYFDETKAQLYLDNYFNEMLSGATLYTVWFGNGETSTGDDLLNVPVVEEVTFKIDGTLNIISHLNSVDGTAKWKIEGNNLFDADVDESFDPSEFTQYVSGSIESGCIKTQWINNNNPDDSNIDLYFTDLQVAKNYANQLKGSITNCPSDLSAY